MYIYTNNILEKNVEVGIKQKYINMFYQGEMIN